jgi:triacylglycerol lipase
LQENLAMASIPVVLAHGIFRIDQLRILFQQQLGIEHGLHYFLGIAPFLREHGVQVLETDVSFCGSLERRATQLAKAVDALLTSTGAPKVAIIGHSMGGLDARKMIVDLGFHDKVASLTTIGTPHHGSSSADDLGHFLGDATIAQLKPFIDLEGFRDLTTTACAKLNDRLQKHEADNEVRYRAVSASEGVLEIVPFLQPTALRLAREGPNDGIVPVHSQQWTRLLVGTGATPKPVEQIAFPIPADHLNEIGWWDIGELTNGLSPRRFGDRVKQFYLQLALTAG